MIKPWKKLKEKTTQVGFRTIVTRTFKLQDNSTSNWDIKQENPVVSILALTKDNKVILNRQFRPGPEKILLEIPGGMVDKNEIPLKAAKREFLEETGYTGDFQFVGESLACAYSTRIRYHFVTTNCHKTQKQKLENDEFIEIVKMPLEDFRRHLKNGQLTDVASGYLGLDHLKLLN